MEVKVTRVTDWQRVLNAARLTIGKEPLENEPSDEFKRKMCRAEHSPLRLLEFDIQLIDVPSYVQNHLVRHKHGVEFFVRTARPDRNGRKVSRHEQRKDDPCTMQISINAQALINISRKRLCRMAENTTRIWWAKVVYELGKIEPILASYCRPDCEYKRHCTEFKPCGHWEKAKERYKD